VQSFLPSFGIPGTTWRDASHRLRVKCALLLLSAEDASVSEVAASAGYASAEALGRAFRDAGLDAPSRIQERLRIARGAFGPNAPVE
jgi:transcriptional regulator GlxA family with amidase domain